MYIILSLVAVAVAIVILLRYGRYRNAVSGPQLPLRPLKERLESLGDLSRIRKNEIVRKLGKPLSKFTTPDCSILRWQDDELEISIRFDHKGNYQELIRMN